MGIFAINRSDYGSNCARIRTPLIGILLTIAFLAVSGCVSNTTLPSNNIATLLTPVEGDRPEKASDTLESKLAGIKPQTGPTPPAKEKEELSPAIKNALVPTSKETQAESAVNKVANSSSTIASKEPDADSVTKPATKPTTGETKIAALTPAAIPDKKPVAKKKAPALFGGFFSKNQAGTPQALRAETRTIRKKRVVAKLNSRGAVKTIRSNRKNRPRANTTSLPGVNLKRLFGIDTEDTEELDEPEQLASVTNRARRGTHGLLLQRKDVKVGCFPPDLVRILKQVERRFGCTPIVTSGYRSRSYNRRIRGARNSMHIHCKAADIQVKGVSKWKLAKYLRSLPGRGGVGTYCHTRSVHIDVAGKRDWNRRCRRSRKRRRT